MKPIRMILVIALGVALVSVGWSLIHERPEPPLPRLRVEVLNGCGVSGLAQRAAHRLQVLGQDVIRVEDAEHHEFARTFLIDRQGKQQLTKRLVGRVGTVPMVLERIEGIDVDATLVLGADWADLKLFEGDPALSLSR